MWNILSFLKSFCVMVQISALYNSTNMTRVQNTLILVVLNRLSLRTPSYATFGTLSPLSLFGCPPTVCDTENLHFSADCTSNRHLPSSPDTTFLHTFIQQCSLCVLGPHTSTVLSSKLPCWQRPLSSYQATHFVHTHLSSYLKFWASSHIQNPHKVSLIL